MNSDKALRQALFILAALPDQRHAASCSGTPCDCGASAAQTAIDEFVDEHGALLMDEETTLEYAFDFTCGNEECECSIPCAITPAVPPKPCSDHDHPAYADPGDPGDVEYPEVCPQCGTALNGDRVYDVGMDKLSRETPEY